MKSSNMKLSFATLGCPGWNLEQIADQALAMGYDGVELRGVQGEHIGPGETPGELSRIKKIFEDRGLDIACIMGYSRFTWADEKQRAEEISKALTMLELAGAVGCPLLRVFGGKMEGGDREANIARVVECLGILAPSARKLGVQMALETHDDWCRGENLSAVLRGVDDPALGVCWDVANSHFVEPLEKTFDALKDRLCHVHLKDAAKLNGKEVGRLPGTGEVDLRKAMKILAGAGYDGYLSFEWEKKWQPDIEEPEVAFPAYIRYVRGLMEEFPVRR